MFIDHFEINEKSSIFIVAELSANHGGSLEKAKETIRAAKRAGANAIKLQSYTPDTITLNSRKEDFQIKEGIWKGQYLHDLYKKAYTPFEWHEKLFKTAKEEGIICFSSPFDKGSVDLLENLNTPAYKIASLEITDIPLIEYVASKGKPVIISTGIAGEDDIDLAIEACKKMGNDQIGLLKCTSAYPTSMDDANVIMVSNFAKRFNVVAGISDHSVGITVPVVATCFGAKIIEKHLILNKSIDSPDASFSLDEKEFTEMVKSIRDAERAIGIVDFSLTAEQKKAKEFSRSLYVVEPIKAGELITTENVRSIRPANGLHPKFYREVLGKTATRNIEKGEPLDFNQITKIE